MNVLNVTRNNGEFICHLHDKKFYKSVNLSNNLTAVLISSNSKEDDTASIALSIHAGSFDDPKGYEGLAHLMSNLIIIETKFVEKFENEEIIMDEEEEILEEKVVEQPTRSKRLRSNKVNQTKKVVKQTKKILEEPAKERQTSDLMYMLNTMKGTIKLNTEFEYTTFQLDLPTQNLKTILDDFYLRFKDQPTLSEYLIRETLKVLKHDYFQKIKENPMMELKMLLCNLVEDEKLKNYPSNPFLEVQTEEDFKQLREKLLEFYGTYYKANRMKLILKSNLSIEKMEQMLNESFNNLKVEKESESLDEMSSKSSSSQKHNRVFFEKENQKMFYIKPHNKKPEIEDYLPIRQNLMVNLDKFEEHNLNKQLEEKLVEENGLDKIISNKISFDNNHLIFNYTSQRQIQSKEDELITDQLCYIFNIPYDKTYYPLMPMHFISSLICKDGPGTLISYLRERDLIVKIQAGNLHDCNFSNNSLWTLFFIKFYLTEKGMGMLNEITKFLNSYLNMLMNLESLESLFSEYCNLMLFDYNFKEIRSASSHDLFVTVKKMHLFPIKHVLVANRIPLHKTLDRNFKLIRNLMKFIKLENSIIAVLTDESSFNKVDANFETFKGIDLKKMPVDSFAFEKSDLFKIEDFPKSNPFLKNNLKINLEQKVYLVPEKINQNEHAKLWFKKECSELLSLTSVNLLISHEMFKKNAKLATVCDLILVISEMHMQELFFQIREAGFLYRVESNRFGFNISATGSDGIINVFKQILTNFKSVSTAEKLEKAKKIAIRNYENALKNKFVVYLDLQNCLLFENHYTIQDRNAEVEHVELKDLNRMMNMIFNQSKRDYLIQGNYTVRDSNKFFNEIEKMFEYQCDETFNETTMNVSEELSEDISEIEETKITNTKSTINQTYSVNKIVEKEQKVRKAKEDEFYKNRKELFPRKYTEYYCLAKIGIDSPEPVLNEVTMANEIDLSMTCDTPDSSYDQQFKSRPDNKRCIESTSVKNAPNRKLLMESNSCITFNASRIERTNTTRTTKSNSILKSVCTDITNVNYNLSPLNNSNNSNNDSHNFSTVINKDTQIVGNLYFTDYRDDVQHDLLLSILVELIKQNMNGFFTNEENLRDNFFRAEHSLKNLSTPEITFQGQVLIDGQIECAKFELTNSKDLVQHKFDSIAKQMLVELNKKASWSQDVSRNWKEIVIDKRRFEMRKQQVNALKTKINLNFFKRWAMSVLGKINYSKLSIQFLKDEQRFDSDFCDKKKLEIQKPHKQAGCKMHGIKTHLIESLSEFKKK